MKITDQDIKNLIIVRQPSQWIKIKAIAKVTGRIISK